MRYTPILLPFVMIRRWLMRPISLLYYKIKTLLIIKAWRIECGKNVRFIGRTIIRSYDKYGIVIGDNCRFLAGTENNLVGLTNPSVICAAKGARIIIGNDVGCSSVVMHARSSIRIGNYVNIGGNVKILDHDFHPLAWESRRPPQKDDEIRSLPIVIEDDVFVGTNAIILKGTIIGARSIVAAGSVVFGMNVPPDSLVKGNPAIIVKKK